MKKFLSLLLVIVMLLGMTSAFAESNKTNTLYIGEAPETLFGAMWENFGGLYKNNVFRSLLMSNPAFDDVIPDLAEKVDVSEDNLTITLTLREGVTWHDGQPFGAADVVFSLKTALRAGIINTIFTNAFKSIEGAAAYAAGEADDVTGIKAEGNTVTITLEKPYGAFLNVLAQFAIYPEHLLKDADPLTIHNNEFWEMPIGTGPYKVADVAWDDYALLERYDGFYGTQPKIEYIKMSNVSDTVVACMAGEIDYLSTNNADTIAQIEKIDGYKVYPVDIFYMRYFIFNIESPDGTKNAMADARVRKALMYALDRESIVSSLFPTGTITSTFVPANMSAHWDGCENYEYNPEKAKALLQEAGFDFNQTIKLRYYYGDQASIDFMDVISYYWGEVGIKVDTQAFTGDATTQIYDVRDWDVTYKGLSAFGYEEAYGELVSSGNIMKYLVQSDAYDELVNKLNTTLDAEARKDILEELQKLDQEYMFRLPLYSLPNCVIVNTNHLDVGDAQFGNEWYNYDRSFEDWTIVQ